MRQCKHICNNTWGMRLSLSENRARMPDHVSVGLVCAPLKSPAECLKEDGILAALGGAESVDNVRAVLIRGQGVQVCIKQELRAQRQSL
jgi:hypothetical protein